MEKSEKIQKISKLLRYVVLAVAFVSAPLILLTLFDIKQIITPVSAAWFEPIWNSSEHRPLVALFLAPEYIAFFVLLYWLQKLLTEFQSGEFFSELSVKCYLWMAWTQFFRYIYEIVWAPLLSMFIDFEGEIALDIADLISLVLIIFFAHVLKLAREMQTENKGFI